MNTGPTFATPSGPPNIAYTQLIDYDGGASPVYIGLAVSRRTQPKLLVVTSVSKANPGVVTVTAHGLTTGNTVFVSGASGDWAALNGIQIVTSTGANTFTIPINTTAFAGSFDGIIQTYSPQTSQPIWAIQKLFYSGTSVIRTAWAQGQAGEAFIWDNRTTYAYC